MGSSPNTAYLDFCLPTALFDVGQTSICHKTTTIARVKNPRKDASKTREDAGEMQESYSTKLANERTRPQTRVVSLTCSDGPNGVFTDETMHIG
jgi:hypothetical protein